MGTVFDPPESSGGAGVIDGQQLFDDDHALFLDAGAQSIPNAGGVWSIGGDGQIRATNISVDGAGNPWIGNENISPYGFSIVGSSDRVTVYAEDRVPSIAKSIAFDYGNWHAMLMDFDSGGVSIGGTNNNPVTPGPAKLNVSGSLFLNLDDASRNGIVMQGPWNPSNDGSYGNPLALTNAADSDCIFQISAAGTYPPSFGLASSTQGHFIIANGPSFAPTFSVGPDGIITARGAVFNGTSDASADTLIRGAGGWTSLDGSQGLFIQFDDPGKTKFLSMNSSFSQWVPLDFYSNDITFKPQGEGQIRISRILDDNSYPQFVVSNGGGIGFEIFAGINCDTGVPDSVTGGNSFLSYDRQMLQYTPISFYGSFIKLTSDNGAAGIRLDTDGVILTGSDVQLPTTAAAAVALASTHKIAVKDATGTVYYLLAHT